jgi:hypothetical protein
MSVKYSRLAVSVHPPAKPDVTDRLYTAKEVAAKLGVSERWVRDHAASLACAP